MGLRTRRLITSVVAITLALLWPLVLGSDPARAQSGPGQTTTTTATPKPRVRLMEQTPFVGPTGAFQLRLHVTDAPDDAVLTFKLFDNTSSQGRIHYLQTMRGEQLGAPIHQPYTVPVSNLPTEDNVSVIANFQIDANRQPFLGFRLQREGVYPMSVSLQTAGGKDLDSFVTDLIRLPSSARNDNPPLAISLVAPIDAPVALQTDGKTELDPTAAAGLSDTVDMLAERKEVPLTVAAVPETVVALQKRDKQNGTTVTNTLAESLEGRQVLGSPYVRLNVGAYVNDAMNDELLRQLNEGSDTLASILDARPDRRTWILDKSITPQAMAHLRTLGVDQVVVPEELLTPLDPRAFSVALTRSFEIDAGNQRTRAVQADTTLRLHLGVSDNPVLSANRLLGDLAIMYFDQPQLKRGAVLLLPDNGATPKEYLRTLLAALGSTIPVDSGAAAIMTPTTLDRLFAFVEPAGQNGGRGAALGVSRPEPTLLRGWTADPPGTLGDYPQQLANANRSVDSYQSMQVPASDRVQPLRTRLTVSGASQFDRAQRQAYLDGTVGFVNSQAQEIDVPEQQRITLTSSAGSVPLVLDNKLDYPVKVRVRLESDKIEFVDSNDFTAALQPGSNRIDLSVRSKTSGAFPVNVTVSSPDDTLPMSSGRLPIRSTAISGIGLILTIGAGLFLAIWWARHYRSARRHRRLISTENHPTAGDGRTQPVEVPTAKSPDTRSVDTASPTASASSAHEDV